MVEGVQQGPVLVGTFLNGSWNGEHPQHGQHGDG